MNRRSFAVSIVGGLAACKAASAGVRLMARPGAAPTGCAPGLHELALRKKRDAMLYVPKSAPAEKPAPLLIFLHGAGGSEQGGIKRLSSYADESGFLLLSPASQGSTWDAIEDGYGPDVRIVDQALARVFGLRSVDPKRIALCGFSDGASYALGLGLGNGDLFTSLMAFSPGFIPRDPDRVGNPRVFISHGTNDAILPIDTCSRRLVPALKQKGYAVTYREFDGPHTVPPDITRAGLDWFLAG